MAHSREIRAHASEVKFVVSPEQADSVRRWARTHLAPDPHGSGAFGDEYRTTSVYFDSEAYDVFHRRGSFGRSKYRVRRYGDDRFVFLERKMRQPAVLAKRRTWTALASLHHLTGTEVDEAWPGCWFHRRLVARRLQPVCQISYSRMARGVIRDGEQVRLTLDSDLTAQPSAGLTFSNGAAVPIFSERHILELKYRGAPPAVFRHLVEELALNPQVASKYRMGVAALLVPETRVAFASEGRGEAFHA
jgi:hypothetical protein